MLTFCNRIGTNEKGGLHYLLSYILISTILIKRLYLFFLYKGHAAQRTINLYRKTILIHRPMLKLTHPFLDPERGDENCWHTNTKHIKLVEIRNPRRLGLGLSLAVASAWALQVVAAKALYNRQKILFKIWYWVVNIVCVNLFCNFLMKNMPRH